MAQPLPQADFDIFDQSMDDVVERLQEDAQSNLNQARADVERAQNRGLAASSLAVAALELKKLRNLPARDNSDVLAAIAEMRADMDQKFDVVNTALTALNTKFDGLSLEMQATHVSQTR